MASLSVSAIRADARCQPRVTIDSRVVEDYADEMTGGAEFPPLTVYHDGATYWLADGFHRLSAAIKIGRETVECDVRRGTMRDAILHAAGANRDHGLRRTNADKRRAVEALLNDPEWVTWSDWEISRRCGVSQPFVGSVRSSLITVISHETRKGADGREINTANIGRRVDQLPRQSLPERVPAAAVGRVDLLTGEILDDDDDAEPEPPRRVNPPNPAPKPAPPPPPVQWDDQDARAFTSLLSLQDATGRDAEAVAAAAMATNPIGARLFAQRAVEILTWYRDFADELITRTR